jgi:hypothetical protein
MNQLIAEAVRIAFQPAKGTAGARAIARPGKGIVVMPKGVRITDADVASAMEEMP